eukprot:169889_1
MIFSWYEQCVHPHGATKNRRKYYQKKKNISPQNIQQTTCRLSIIQSETCVYFDRGLRHKHKPEVEAPSHGSYYVKWRGEQWFPPPKQTNKNGNSLFSYKKIRCVREWACVKYK